MGRSNVKFEGVRPFVACALHWRRRVFPKALVGYSPGVNDQRPSGHERNMRFWLRPSKDLSGANQNALTTRRAQKNMVPLTNCKR